MLCCVCIEAMLQLNYTVVMYAIYTQWLNMFIEYVSKPSAF